MNSPATQPVLNPTAPGESPARGPVVPIWLIVFTFMLLYWGAVYFDANGGWFDSNVYGPYHSVAELETLQPSKEGVEGKKAFGKLIYNKPTCSACHQASGQGSPGQY